MYIFASVCCMILQSACYTVITYVDWLALLSVICYTYQLMWYVHYFLQHKCLLVL